MNKLIIAIAVLVCASCKPEKNTVKTGGLNLYYERTGKGEAIVLLHAGLQDHTMWQQQVKALSKQYEVITPDLPFHGKTTGVDTIILACDVIKMLLDSLHIEKASIAGLSMGAAVALDFVIAYPQRVNKVFLISAGVNGYDRDHPVDSVSMHHFNRFFSALDQKDTAKAAAEFTRVWAEGIYRAGDSLQAPVSKYVYRTTLAHMHLQNVEYWPRMQNNPKAIDGLSAIQAPVMIINGDKDLPIITATSQYLGTHIKGARHIVMKDVAHMLNMEKPAELNKLMLDFLNH